MPRRVYLLGLGVALVGLALAFTDWALSLRPGVSEQNVKRIRPGMTLAEVEALLGGRAGEEHPLEEWAGPVVRAWARHWGRFWRGAAGRAEVCFDRDERVEWAAFRPAPGGTTGPLARLRAWLGW